MRVIPWIIGVGSLCWSMAWAQIPAPVPAPPTVPAGVDLDITPEPEVTISQREGERVEEYRIRGQLYMVKITPRQGKPYVLDKQDKDGQFVRRDDICGTLAVPQWVIFQF